MQQLQVLGVWVCIVLAEKVLQHNMHLLLQLLHLCKRIARLVLACCGCGITRCDLFGKPVPSFHKVSQPLAVVALLVLLYTLLPLLLLLQLLRVG
jgi:hypothetical protein